jgi:hypothetical protein
MPLDWRAISDRTCATARLIIRRVVSRFASSVIWPNGQRDHPRLIGCKRRGLEQVRFISSQAQEAVLSDLTAIVLEALHQFGGP